MLRDPNQGRRAHLGAFRAWLAMHPADKEYSWASCSDCLLCRYFGKPYWDLYAAGDLDPIGFDTAMRIARGASPEVPPGEQTYGAALARCESELERA